VLVIAACVLLVLVGVAIVVRWDGAQAPTRRTGLAPWARYVGLTAAAGLAAGALAAGAGGRLVMRLLAITSPDAEGAITEAEQVVGEITAGGTLGFVVFVGLPAGLITALSYAILRPILPAGRTGGAILGAVVLVVLGTNLEPLRADNFDFNIVGPAWLSVLAFTALALFQGMVTAALAARVPGPPPLSGRKLAVARAVLAIVVLAFLPGFVSAVSDILG
jgi:hypothetical protein